MSLEIGTYGHDVLIIDGKTKEGIRRTVRFWADRGLIHSEDSIDNSYETLSVREFLRRALALSQMLGNSADTDGKGADADLKSYVQNIVDKAAAIAKKAQDQGMPDDASARRDLRRRQPVTVCVSGGNAIM